MKMEVPQKVKASNYGCPNCLWASCECRQGSMYKPKTDKDINCKAYTYYD
jgi:hypothetical protein